MRNVIKFRGQFLKPLPVQERDSFVTRLYSDASFDTQSKDTTKHNIIGYGYCVQLLDYMSPNAIPAYGYGVVRQNINSCSTTAELLGIIYSMRDTGLSSNVEIVCDNIDAVNIINHLSQGYERRFFHGSHIMLDALDEINDIVDESITARWVKGHSQDDYNNTVNMLARLARKTNGAEIGARSLLMRESNATASFRKQK